MAGIRQQDMLADPQPPAFSHPVSSDQSSMSATAQAGSLANLHAYAAWLYQHNHHFQAALDAQADLMAASVTGPTEQFPTGYTQLHESQSTAVQQPQTFSQRPGMPDSSVPTAGLQMSGGAAGSWPFPMPGYAQTQAAAAACSAPTGVVQSPPPTRLSETDYRGKCWVHATCDLPCYADRHSHAAANRAW